MAPVGSPKTDAPKDNSKLEGNSLVSTSCENKPMKSILSLRHSTSLESTETTSNKLSNMTSSPLIKRPIEMLSSGTADNSCKKLNSLSDEDSGGSLSRITHLIGNFLSKNDATVS